MAIFSLADLSAVMPTFYREVVANIQRKAVIARVLRWREPVDAQGPRWGVTFSGQAAGNVDADGGAFITATADTRVSANLGWGEYSGPVKVTDKAQWVGANLRNADYLKNMITNNAREAVEAIVKLINQQIYSGTGSSGQMTGLSLAALNSGTYAAINSATYTGWKCSVTSNNSGTPTNLTLAQVKSDLATASVDAANGFGRPDIFVCRSTPFNTLSTAFDAYTQVTFDPTVGQLSMPAGSAQRVQSNPNVISTAGGRIQRNGFRVLRWDSEDLWIIEDPDCTHTGQTNPTSTGYYLNSACTWMEYLPPPAPEGYSPLANQKQIEAVEQELGAIGNLKFEVKNRGRGNFSDELDILGMCQLVVTNRAAIGYRTDIQ